MTRHAVISGGSSGIGLALAQQLAHQGYDVTLIARDPYKLAQAEKQITAAYPTTQVQCLSYDVSHRQDCLAIYQHLTEQQKPINLLICSAGFAHPGTFHLLSDEIHTQTMHINYFGSLYLTQALLPLLTQASKPSIVFISSAAALIGIYGYSAYAPSKYAIMGLAEVLMSELKPLGIHVAVAYPPDTDTPQLHYENQYKPKQTKAITQHGGLISATKAAMHILKQVRRRKHHILFNWETRGLYYFGNLIKPLLTRWFDGIIRRSA